MRHRRLELWTSSQERRGLCQAPDTTCQATRMWLNARNQIKSRPRDLTSSLSAGIPASTPLERWTRECLAFQSMHYPVRLLNPTTRPSGPHPRPGIQVTTTSLAVVDLVAASDEGCVKRAPEETPGRHKYAAQRSKSRRRDFLYVLPASTPLETKGKESVH